MNQLVSVARDEVARAVRKGRYAPAIGAGAPVPDTISVVVSLEG